MDFRFTPEEEAFRTEVRDFIARELTPAALVGEGMAADTPAKQAFLRKLAAQGWLAITWPEEWGGQGKAGMLQAILQDELLYAGARITHSGIGFVGRLLMRYGSERLQREFLPRIARAEIVEFALGYSEPEAGSDLASLQLRAERDGDEYVLNGQKRFTSTAHFAEYVWLAARTDPDAPKHRGISVFLVDLKTPGITIRPLWCLGGIRTNEVFYDNVRVPRAYLVGEENRGWYYMAEALDYERFTVSSAVALFRRQLDDLVGLVSGALWASRPRLPTANVRRRLARLSIDMEVARLHGLRVLAAANEGRVPSIEATMLKLWSTQLAQRVAEAAVDSLGLYGQLREGSKHAPAGGAFARTLEESVIRTISGGTSEVQKNIIAKRALGLPG
jgi:alkylation response protein AidB-like acyl-CoA dehydrogenase